MQESKDRSALTCEDCGHYQEQEFGKPTRCLSCKGTRVLVVPATPQQREVRRLLRLLSKGTSVSPAEMDLLRLSAPHLVEGGWWLGPGPGPEELAVCVRCSKPIDGPVVLQTAATRRGYAWAHVKCHFSEAASTA